MILEVLQRTIFENVILEIDFWTFIHILFGFFVSKKFPDKWKGFLIFTIAFEIVENIVFAGNPLLAENLRNIFTDLIASNLGYFVGNRFWNSKLWIKIKRKLMS